MFYWHLTLFTLVSLIVTLLSDCNLSQGICPVCFSPSELVFVCVALGVSVSTLLGARGSYNSIGVIALIGWHCIIFS
jgi:hypothetical protein